MAKLTKQGAAFIAHFEGVYTHLYNDPAGHCTIGVGHLVHHGPCNGSEPAAFRSGITKKAALDLLQKDASEFARVVTREVKTPLEPHQADALISFAFNVGSQAFSTSTLLRKLNGGDHKSVPSELARWTKAGGVTLPGLVRRRKAEGDLFAKGDYDPAPGTRIKATPGQASRAENQPASVLDVQTALKGIGWPLATDGVAGAQTRQAVADFQRGYGFRKLRIDGVAGPQTFKAIQDSGARKGMCSEHFAYREFASKGNGWISVDRALVVALEKYRERIGGPVGVVSGYRDPAHNSKVGGASASQHLFGTAADIPGVLGVREVAALRLFSGIGHNTSSGKVVHVDVRHAGPKNTTGATTANPTVWQYGR
jgi:GH24 family phage-related lysozyme (muramidase)